MVCSDRLNDLALHAGGDLEEEAAQALEKHLAQCESCRRELDALRGALRLAVGFSPEAPGAQEFLEGVRAARARAGRVRAFRFAAAAAVLLIAVIFTIPFIRGTGTDSMDSMDIAGMQQVEVERVGYEEAVVTIIPADSESMAVVWIVSDEIESE